MKGRRISFTQINSQRKMQKEANPIRQSHKLRSQETGAGSQALSLKCLPGSCPWGNPVISAVPRLLLGLQQPCSGHRASAESSVTRQSGREAEGGGSGGETDLGSGSWVCRRAMRGGDGALHKILGGIRERKGACCWGCFSVPDRPFLPTSKALGLSQRIT